MTLLSPIPLSTGVTLDVWDSGPRDAPALMFLHGFPESHRTWRHQIAHLNQHYRCVAPDQRGYGGSSRPAEVAAYAPPALVADVFALADALGIGPFTVFGHDWGGVVAWIVASIGQFTKRVPRAVIANAPHPGLFQHRLWLDPVQRAASQYIRLFRNPAHDAETLAQGLAPLLQRAFGGAAHYARMEPAEFAALARRWQDGEAALAMLNWYRASPVVVPALEAAYALPEDLPPALPLLTIPTLVLWGEDDSSLPPGNLAGLDAQVPDARIRRLPGVGHFSPWEAADHVNRAIDGFLDET